MWKFSFKGKPKVELEFKFMKAAKGTGSRQINSMAPIEYYRFSRPDSIAFRAYFYGSSNVTNKKLEEEINSTFYNLPKTSKLDVDRTWYSGKYITPAQNTKAFLGFLVTLTQKNAGNLSIDEIKFDEFMSDLVKNAHITPEESVHYKNEIFSAYLEWGHDLIQVLDNNPEEFKRLIQFPFDLLALAKAYPLKADSLIQIILYDINEFKRIVKDHGFLLEFAKLDTQYNHIFNQPTIDQAIDEVIQYQLQQQSISKAEIEKNVNFFLQANKANQAFFPSILEAEIASYTGTYRAHTKEETQKIAYHAMGIS